MDSKTQCKALENSRLWVGLLLLKGVPQVEVAPAVGCWPSDRQRLERAFQG